VSDVNDEREQQAPSRGLPLLWAIAVLLGSGELSWWLLHRFVVLSS
jgi:hypothetical protein